MRPKHPSMHTHTHERRITKHPVLVALEQHCCCAYFVTLPFSSGVGLQLAGKAIDALFGFEPFFDLSVRMAREKIVKRASLVGVNWAGAVDRMRRNMDELEAEYDRLLDREVRTPRFALRPVVVCGRCGGSLVGRSTAVCVSL